MNLPTAMAALAAGALEPALGRAVDVARQEIPAFAAVLGGIGLRDRGHRAARAGLRVFPVLAGILVAPAQNVRGRVAGESEIAVRRRLIFPGERAGDVAAVQLGERPLGKDAAVIAGETAPPRAEPN